jgi:hypothetical protein
MCVYNIQFDCQLYVSEHMATLSNFLSQYYKASGESTFCGWVSMVFGSIVGCQNCIVINDCDEIYVGEYGFLALRLLMGCVDIERSSRHAKLVS